MLQTWSELLFLHWEVPAEAIQSLLPPGLTVDTFEGKAYVGLIPFTMSGVRPAWSPAVPGLSNFHECNVRTYVHFEGEKPGVWFFSLDAANLIAVIIARTLWKLPYFHAKMRLVKESMNSPAEEPNPTNQSWREYESQRLGVPDRAAFCTMRYQPKGEIQTAKLGTLEFFLAERYLLYAFSNRLLRGQVHHSPYPLQSAEIRNLDENLVLQAGLKRPDIKPIIHYATKVDVEIFPLRRL